MLHKYIKNTNPIEPVYSHMYEDGLGYFFNFGLIIYG